VTGKRLAYQSEVAPIEQLFLKHARDAFVSPAAVDEQWRGLNYTAPPALDRAIREYEDLLSLISSLGVADLHFLPADGRVGLDSIYVRDPSVACDEGMILCRMGKAQREAEPAVLEEIYRAAGVQVRGSIVGEGRLEGGDTVWIDPRTLVVARSDRTNEEGIRQLKGLVRGCAEEVIVVELPQWRGPGDVFHLMSILSPIDHDLALIYSPLMPDTLRDALTSRGIEMIEVPENEFDTMGCNALALAPRTCILLKGNPETCRRLRSHGARAHTFEGREICAKGSGGPTCLTRPTLRNMTTSR
jgi:N-dimethylarginine dimethylaminohydrolase